MYEQRTVASPLVNCIWRATADSDGIYSDPANEYWGIGFIKHVDGTMSADLFGPSITPRTLKGYKGEEYWGIEFYAHVAIRVVDKAGVLGLAIPLPAEDGQLIIQGRRYRIPAFDWLEAFASQLKGINRIISFG